MKAVLFAAAALLLSACSESTGPRADLRIETSKAVYTLPGPGDPDALVQYSVRNTGSGSLALPQCNAVIGELQRKEGNDWVTVASGPCPAVLAIYAPLVLEPGEAAFGEASVGVAGRYRIRVDAAEEVGKEFTASATSPEFVVRWLED
jgi:hypothetical protein